MNEKYLFFDMDRTLISPVDRRIPASAVEALHQAMDNGHHCFLCTGRGLKMACEYQDIIHMPGIIFSNGGGIMWNDQILETRDIPSKTVHQMMEITDWLGGRLQLLTTTYAWQNEKQRKMWLERLQHDNPDKNPEDILAGRKMADIRNYQDEPVQKIDVSFVDELTADVFFSRVPDSLELVLAGGYFTGMGKTGGELTAKGVTKGSGIERVMEIFGADIEDTYAFGDSTNDIAMMQVCHTSTAMGNASKDCMEICDYVTDDCDHDGIYHALKHFELI